MEPQRRLSYLILMYAAIFITAVFLYSCEEVERLVSNPEEMKAADQASDFDVFKRENMEPESDSTDPLFDYGYSFEAQRIDDTTHVFEGDILIDTRRKVKIYEKGEVDTYIMMKGVARTTGLWVDNIIYYQFAPTLHPDAKKEAVEAMRILTDKTFLKFIEQPNSKGYVYFQNGTGCSSYVGRIGYKQAINLSTTRCGLGSTIHEIMHAAGFWHEQSRPDRDNYVKVLWENISDGRSHNFQKVSIYGNAELTKDLDFGSIMLYSSKSFSKNGLPTMIKLDGSQFTGQRSGPSVGDLESLKKLYPDLTPPVTPEPAPVPAPTYENGKYYTINGIKVYRLTDKWYYLTNVGWREVELVARPDGSQVWEYASGTELPDELKYVNGQTYYINNIWVLRKDNKWYYYSRTCVCWREVVLRDNKWYYV